MNGRICTRCGRPLNEDEHTLGDPRIVFVRRGRGRVKVQKVRTYECKVRLAGTKPDGETFVPATPDRIGDRDISFRHESRFTQA